MLKDTNVLMMTGLNLFQQIMHFSSENMWNMP